MHARPFASVLLFTALAAPVTAGPLEVGANDFRISTMGCTGDPAYGVNQTAVAYNPHRNEYLVVWAGSDDLAGQAAGLREIFVQRIDAATGQELGADDRRISAVGGPDVTQVQFPDVVYNADAREYMVVWWSFVVGGGSSIQGQRLAGTTGAEIGADDFAITTGSPADALPAVAYNPLGDRYLVVWKGSARPPQAASEEEIFGRLFDTAGQPLGPERRLSAMGGLGDPAFSVERPDVAYDPALDRFLVVWAGEDDRAGLTGSELAVFGQLVDGMTGVEVGSDDVLLSDTADGLPQTSASQPAAIYDPSTESFAVAFAASPFAVTSETHVHFQRVGSVLGLPLLAEDVAISEQPAVGGSFVETPALAFREGDGNLLVAWRDRLPSFETEIRGRFVDAEGRGQTPSVRLSDVGGLGDSRFLAFAPAVAASPGGPPLVVWPADDPDAGLADDEIELFGQLVAPVVFGDGFERGDLAAWSLVVP